MATADTAKKLRLHTARRALILNAPDGYLARLGEPPQGVVIETVPSGTFDFAHLFVRDRSELDQFLGQVLGVIEYDALLWISYPKGSAGLKTDLNRDKLWVILQDQGIRPVSMVSIDETWSAMRLRPADAVGK